MDINKMLEMLPKSINGASENDCASDMTFAETFIQTAFDSIMEEAFSEAYGRFKLGDGTDLTKLHYDTAVIGHNKWGEFSESVNSLDIPFVMANGKVTTLMLDKYGFIIALLQLEPDIRDNYKMAINDIIDSDIGPEYRKMKAEKLAEQPVSENVNVDLRDDIDVTDDNVLNEFFRTFMKLKTFKQSGEYSTEDETNLHDRLIKLYERVCSN